MTILQEASTKALDALRKAMQGNLDFDVALEAFEALRTALAQQVAPVAEPTDDQLVKGVKAMRLFVTKNSVADFRLGYMAALAAAPAPQAQEPIAKLFGTLPVYDTPEPQAQDKSDNYLSGYCTGRTDLLKEQSAQPAQGVPEVGFGNMQSAQPVAQPLPDPCHTCAHYQQGKLPGVRIHDETCYECRSYWGNKWEAA